MIRIGILLIAVQRDPVPRICFPIEDLCYFAEPFEILIGITTDLDLEPAQTVSLNVLDQAHRKPIFWSVSRPLFQIIQQPDRMAHCYGSRQRCWMKTPVGQV